MDIYLNISQKMAKQTVFLAEKMRCVLVKNIIATIKTIYIILIVQRKHSIVFKILVNNPQAYWQIKPTKMYHVKLYLTNHSYKCISSHYIGCSTISLAAMV